MEELPMQILRAAARYKPIETDGLTLYPIVVKNYDAFLIARPALEVMHQSLPVTLMRMPLLSALYQIDFDAVFSGVQHTGLFSRTLLALALSLRLGEEKPIEERMTAFQIMVDPENPARLMLLRFYDEAGDCHDITPAMYAKLRKIIAVQNGVHLESDKANPDIVKAAKDKAAANVTDLDANIDDWISAVSALSGTQEDEIDEWPILKFQRRSDSYRRILDYLICGVGECSGMVSWPKGNPAPHPFFAKAENGNGILSAMGGTADGKSEKPPSAATSIMEITKNL